jgi:hypothetical protein
LRRYVAKNRKPQPAPPLPKGQYVGGTFEDVDGALYDVLWAGHRDASLLGSVEQNPHGQEPRLALRRAR